MNKKKTLLMSMSSVIAATIGLTVFGGTVFAAPGDPLEPTTDHYRIWVANTEITSDNRDNVLAGDPVNDGKVKYDPVNHILSFDDAVITTGYDYYQGNTCGVFIEDYSSDGYNNNYVYIDGSGNIYVNDVLLEENYGTEVILNAGLASSEVHLGADEYFVLGDNRNNSTDSRFEAVGNIKGDDIVGKAWLRVFPFKEFGLVDNIE